MATEVKSKIQGIRVEQYGTPEVMKLSQIELPAPGAGEARIKIYAAGLNFIDIHYRRGTYRTNIPLPYTPGLEAAGVVESIGEGVTTVKIGDRVAYTYGLGSYAQASIVKVDLLIPLPANISFEQGAAFPLQGMTAHYLLHEFYKLKSGDSVLIHAAAGGMGGLLVQWAKHLGARVIGTVSSEAKAKIARASGADEIIIYSEQDFVQESKRLTEGKGPQLIIDAVGKDTFTKDLEAVAKRGHIVLYGSASGQAAPLLPNSLQNGSRTISGGTLSDFVSTREELLMRAKAVLTGMQEGWLRLQIEHVFPLEEAAKAHEMLESRSTTGKIVLRCAQ